ncbi:MAG: hypothetical protein JW748_03575 [Anaerolineales bacterium]|nr:hypothetical protein [Anaerolineales bacterium]
MLKKLSPGSKKIESRGCGIFFGLFLAGSAFPGLVALVRILSDDPESEWVTSGISIFFVAACIVIGLAVIAVNVISWISEARIGKPEVSINAESVRVGDGFSVNYSQTFRQKTEVTKIRMSLIKRESATFSAGTDTTTVTHDEPAGEFEAPPKLFEAGEKLNFSRGMKIPAGGMHTFRTKHNEISWLVRVKVDITGWPDYSEEFEVRVLAGRVAG